MRDREVVDLEQSWSTDRRWADVQRRHSAEDVVRLRGAVKIEYTLATLGAERLWKLLCTEPYVARWGPRRGTRQCKWFRRDSRRFTSAVGRWRAT